MRKEEGVGIKTGREGLGLLVRIDWRVGPGIFAQHFVQIQIYKCRVLIFCTDDEVPSECLE
jgi:hypothetical protein